MNTSWVHQAMACIEADFQRSSDTHLIALDLPGWRAVGIDLYLKDESTPLTIVALHSPEAPSIRLLLASCTSWSLGKWSTS